MDVINKRDGNIIPTKLNTFCFKIFKYDIMLQNKKLFKNCNFLNKLLFKKFNFFENFKYNKKIITFFINKLVDFYNNLN